MHTCTCMYLTHKHAHSRVDTHTHTHLRWCLLRFDLHSFFPDPLGFGYSGAFTDYSVLWDDYANRELSNTPDHLACRESFAH